MVPPFNNFHMGIRIEKAVKESKSSQLSEFLNKDINLGSVFSNKKKQELYNGLYLLFVSGLDMKRVLELVVSEKKSKKEKIILDRVNQNVIKGHNLSEALSFEKDFTDYEIYSLQIGEQSGQLVEVLFHLKNYFQKKIEQKRIVTSALAYPITVLFIAIAAVSFMIGFVVPTFAKTFNTFGAELPAITQGLIDFSTNFDTIVIVVLAATTVAVVLYFIFRQHVLFRKYAAKVTLSIPFIGNIILLSKLTQFSENMKLLMSSRTSLIESLGLTSKMLRFYPMQTALSGCKNQIMNGKSLSESMSAYKIFPSRMVYLLAVGEEVNKLDSIFEQLSELYGNELEHKSKILGSVLEPILLIFIAVLVGFIVIALYMPMFSLSDLL